MKNFILKGITWFMALMALLGMCMMDSEDLTVPAIMAIVGWSWCLLFYYVNEEYLEERL